MNEATDVQPEVEEEKLPETTADEGAKEEALDGAEQPAEPVEEKKMTEAEMAIFESRKVLKDPPAPGLAYFEAPDGFIIVGEAGYRNVIDRRTGTRINPIR